MRTSRIAAGVLLCAVVCAACGGSSHTPSSASRNSPTASPAALPPVQPLTAAGAKAVPAGSNLDWLLAVGTDVWVSAGAEVQRYDATGRRTAAAPAPDVCAAMDTNAGSLWVASCRDSGPMLVRIDVATGRTLASIPIPGGLSNESSVAAADDGIWLVRAEAPRSLVVVDPKTNKVARTVPVPAGVSAVRAGFGSVWAASTIDSELLRLDPVTGATTSTIRVGAGPRFLTTGFESVWVLNQRDGSVSRVDPQTEKVLATIDIGQPVFGGDIAVGPDAVWVHPTDALAVRIDPMTDKVTERIGTEAVSGGIAATETALWITEHQTDTLWRLPL